MTENGLDRDTALAAVDEALATGRVSAADPAARELQDLALAIEAESELPTDEFARELDARVAAGFPRRRRRLPGLPAFSLTGRRAIALASAAATLLIVVGVALEVSREDPAEQDQLAAEPLESSGAVTEAAPPPGELDQALRRQVPPTVATDGREARGGAAPGERDRRIERSAELTLAAPDDELDEVADSIVRVTDRHRGFVLRSSVASGDDSEQGGSFDLRIPAESLQVALRDLSKLGHVRARRQAGRDITPAFVSSRDRLEAARAERRGLLRRLESADSDAEAGRIRGRLDAVSLRIERLRRELGALRERANYASVTVDLEGTDGDGGGTGGSGTRDALDDSLGLLEGSLNVLVRVLGVLIPLGMVAGLGWLGGRLLRRRRREGALR